jgi:short subunit dehydrogenase-like uncharacterized protein
VGGVLIYGASGYVGRAAVARALERGLRPVLGGRSDSVKNLADGLGAEAVVVGIDDAAGLAAAVADMAVVLNCAGPFHRTYRQLFDACLSTGTHYVDISGERVVYEAAAARDGDAGRAGVMLLPGAGFDVVATDCLAAHLAARLPTATDLRLAFMIVGPAALPPGTVKTMVDIAAVRSSREHRVAGTIVEAVPRPTLMVDFGTGPTTSALLTWGDIDLAEKSTGIPNVDVYAALSPERVKQTDQLDRLRWLLRFRAVRELITRRVPAGASAEQRAATTTHVWGEVFDPDGNRAIGRIHGPEAGLEWTSRSAIDVVARVLAGHAPPGHQTPSTAYGPDLVLEAEGVTREDVA